LREKKPFGGPKRTRVIKMTRKQEHKKTKWDCQKRKKKKKKGAQRRDCFRGVPPSTTSQTIAGIFQKKGGGKKGGGGMVGTLTTKKGQAATTSKKDKAKRGPRGKNTSMTKKKETEKSSVRGAVFTGVRDQGGTSRTLGRAPSHFGGGGSVDWEMRDNSSIAPQESLVEVLSQKKKIKKRGVT